MSKPFMGLIGLLTAGCITVGPDYVPPDSNALIDRAIGGNLDLRQAAARIREARAQRGISEAERFPTIDATGSVARKRFRFGTSQDNVLGNTTSLGFKLIQGNGISHGSSKGNEFLGTDVRMNGVRGLQMNNLQFIAGSG